MKTQLESLVRKLFGACGNKVAQGGLWPASPTSRKSGVWTSVKAKGYIDETYL